MNIKSLIQKSLVVLFGLFFVVVLLEVGLRVSGFVSLQKTTADSRTKAELGKDTKVLLCLGDSFTFGLGAPEGMSYPEQLERLGREQGFDIAVINRGQCAANTSMVLNRLENNLSKIRPDIVLLLTGGPNAWNTYDMPGVRNSWSSSVRNFILRIRLFRFLKLLGINLSKSYWKKSPSVGLIEEDMGFPVFGVEPGGEEVLEQAEEKPVSVSAEKDVRVESAEINKADRERFLSLGNECFYAQKYDEAVDWFEKLKAVSRNEDVAYFLIYRTYMEQGKIDEAIEFLKQSLLEQPQLMQLRRDAVFVLLPKNRIQEAIEFVLGGLRQKPLSRQALNVVLDFFMFVNFSDNSKAGVELVSRIKEEALVEPAMLSAFEAITKKGGAVWASEWVDSDLRNIIKICHSYGAKVLVQNYPDNIAMTDLFFSAASSQGAPFLNQRRSFLRLGEDERRLFFAPDGHCNERGYKRMAVNILIKLSGLGWLKKTQA